jgi:hypothetical protein
LKFATDIRGECSLKERQDNVKKDPLRREVGEKLFAEPFWPVPRVLAWIAFRHEWALPASLRPGSWFVRAAIWQVRDEDRERTLLRAIQEGRLPALKEGKELPREYWAGADPDAWPIVYFRGEDVLAVWPKLPLEKRHREQARERSDEHVFKTGSLESTEFLPIQNKPGKPGIKMKAAIAAMRAAVEGGKISLLQLREMKEKSLSEFYPDAKRTVLAEARRRFLGEIATERRQDTDIKPTNDK